MPMHHAGPTDGDKKMKAEPDKYYDENKKQVGYSRKYDAYYDLETLEWTEKKCSDKDCEFCSVRPEKYDMS